VGGELAVAKSVYGTVLQTPDGRTLLYDAGAIQGPDVTRRNIAPFLWSQGITRIDEVFLSHADLDHYNGLPSRRRNGTGMNPTKTKRAPLRSARIGVAEPAQ
jgi:competence protein ComEC